MNSPTDPPPAPRLLSREKFTGERALFGSRNLEIADSIFEDGESPLKESADIVLRGSAFKWKYPLWYCRNITTSHCHWFEMARAGVWYSKNIAVEDAIIEAPKNFRRCDGLTLRRVHLPNAAETLWHCRNVELEDVQAKGDYFAMNAESLRISHLSLLGNYSFDGVRNMDISDSGLLSKDAFWNSDGVTARNCYISGEYLGWNARNLTLIDCTIESLQGLCYIDNLVLRNCKLLNTTLAFEYSSVEADICGGVDSVLNPSSGIIRADSIGELILQKDKVDPTKTQIIIR